LSYSPTLYFVLCFTSLRPVLSKVEGSYSPTLAIPMANI